MTSRKTVTVRGVVLGVKKHFTLLIVITLIVNKYGTDFVQIYPVDSRIVYNFVGCNLTSNLSLFLKV